MCGAVQQASDAKPLEVLRVDHFERVQSQVRGRTLGVSAEERVACQPAGCGAESVAKNSWWVAAGAEPVVKKSGSETVVFDRRAALDIAPQFACDDTQKLTHRSAAAERLVQEGIHRLRVQGDVQAAG
jgi:hypothetical protein